MSQMKLLLESWRSFQLIEQKAPKFKEDPADTITLFKALASEKDKNKVKAFIQHIEQDPEVAAAIKALEEMLADVMADEPDDIEEGLDDLGDLYTQAGQLTWNLKDKVAEYLRHNPALVRISGPLLAIALSVLAVKGVNTGDPFTQGTLTTVSKLASGAATPETLAQAVGDLGTEVAEELVQERKRK